MRGRKTPIKIILTDEERREMESLLRKYTMSTGLAQRIRIILMISEGCHSLTEIGRILKVQRRIVRKWGRRFMEQRMEGLEDAPRSGRPPVFSPCGSNPSGKNGL